MYLRITQLADVLLVVTFSMFFLGIPGGIFLLGKTGCPFIGVFFAWGKPDNTVLIYLIEEKLWSYYHFFFVDNYL